VLYNIFEAQQKRVRSSSDPFSVSPIVKPNLLPSVTLYIKTKIYQKKSAKTDNFPQNTTYYISIFASCGLFSEKTHKFNFNGSLSKITRPRTYSYYDSKT